MPCSSRIPHHLGIGIDRNIVFFIGDNQNSSVVSLSSNDALQIAFL